MFLNKLFTRSKTPKATIHVPSGELNKAIQSNRNSLALVKDWIDEAAFQTSFFSYGVPDFIKVHINKPLNSEPTYSDYMLLIANKYFKKVDYLEIGVSVGKNFFQMLNGIENGSFTGFDIEEINPVLEKTLSFKNNEEWETKAESIKTNRSSLRQYKYRGKDVRYLSADVWDTNSWAKLSGSKFNLLFSDALHTPEAILFEFEMLVKFQLLDEKFVIVWDDLVGNMQNSFFEIIKKYDKAFAIKEIYLTQMNGWVGEHEAPHSVGIISNFRF